MKTAIIFLLSTIFATSHGLKCYVCSKSAAETSDLCVNSPGSVTTGSSTVTCGGRYCTIKRQEYKNPPGRIASFYRGCENNPVHLNTMVEDTDFKTYFRACTSDLCNTGNGIQLVSSGNLGSSGNTVINLLVPGIGTNSASTAMFSMSLYCVLLFLFLLQIMTWSY